LGQGIAIECRRVAAVSPGIFNVTAVMDPPYSAAPYREVRKSRLGKGVK